jgi:hypothetical protein
MPAKITFPGENTCVANIRARSMKGQFVDIYHANTLAKDRRECTENCHSGIEPLFSAPAITMRLNELLNVVLPVENVKNSARGLAVLQLGSELMGEKVFLRLPFIVAQGSIENCLEIGGGD